VLLPAYGHGRADLDLLEWKLEKWRKTVVFSIFTAGSEEECVGILLYGGRVRYNAKRCKPL
jgi:hypothetical protein